ncbi:MAG: NERD domain-containing protein [Bacteroides sp.]|nr:NERD domain-containing protein [Bacillota bacterium]MCM1393526.1 NERD domain-containing protein [[Eubacterium] siraeum]MCM1456168.1 NERD domain-containing protein [Bacteroides sp.]
MIFAIIGAVVAFVIIILIVLAVKFKKSDTPNEEIRAQRKQGEKGEEVVANILGKTVEGEQYVVNDLLFMSKSGNSSQIDHVLINKSGIWVIETKNWAGRIFGNDEDEKWVQQRRYDGEIKYLRNPVKQNQKHIYNLANALGVSGGIFFNVVVFLNDSDVSGVSSQSIYLLRELKLIRSCDTGVHLSAEQMRDYYNRIIRLKTSCPIGEAEHVKNIKHKNELVEHGLCPLCGGKLVVKNGKYGKFYGCSNFPKCKFKKDISTQ